MGDGVVAGHFRFDKRFQGALDATSVVHMLAVGTEVEGSAAYVAIERITGTLEGRTGAFFMQHNGVMDRGTPSLSLSRGAGLGHRRTGGTVRPHGDRHRRRAALLHVRLRVGH